MHSLQYFNRLPIPVQSNKCISHIPVSVIKFFCSSNKFLFCFRPEITNNEANSLNFILANLSDVSYQAMHNWNTANGN